MYSSITSRLFSNQTFKLANPMALKKPNVNFQSGLSNVINKLGQHNSHAYSTLKPRAQSMFDKGLKDIAKLYPEDHIAHKFIVTEYYNLMSKCPHMSVEDLINEIIEFPKENADEHFIRAEELEKSNIYEEAGASYGLAKKYNPDKYGRIVDERIPSLIEKYNKQKQEREYGAQNKVRLFASPKSLEKNDDPKLIQEKQKDDQKENNRGYRPSYI